MTDILTISIKRPDHDPEKWTAEYYAELIEAGEVQLQAAVDRAADYKAKAVLIKTRWDALQEALYTAWGDDLQRDALTGRYIAYKPLVELCDPMATRAEKERAELDTRLRTLKSYHAIVINKARMAEEQAEREAAQAAQDAENEALRLRVHRAHMPADQRAELDILEARKATQDQRAADHRARQAAAAEARAQLLADARKWVQKATTNGKG